MALSTTPRTTVPHPSRPPHPRAKNAPDRPERAGRRLRKRAPAACAAKTAARPLAVALPHRVLGVFVTVLVLYVALAGRLVYLQILRHDRFQAEADELRGRRRILVPQRGALLDRNGMLLVRNEPVADIVLDPNVWYARGSGGAPVTEATVKAHRKAAIEGLRPFLPDINPVALAQKTTEKGSTGRFHTVYVARGVSRDLAARIKKANLLGVGMVAARKRVALNGTLAAPVLGFTGRDGAGLDGLERQFDEILAGTPGLLEAEFDPQQRTIPGTIRKQVPVQNGRDVVTTLDAGLQHGAQEAVQRAAGEHQAEAVTAIVLDIKTGDILALASAPTFDINQRSDAPPSSRTCRAVTTPFEPGSTLKPITMAAALSEGKVDEHTRFHCSGTRQIGRRSIHCAHGDRHGSEGIVDVIRNSCNIAAAECAFRLGKNRLWEYEKRFGFGERTGAGIPGESPGVLAPPDQWSSMKLANIGFGQGISVTPLQLAAAYAAIANDGVWMRPRIVWGTRPGDDGVMEPVPIEPGRRVVSPEVARQVCAMMQAVVEDGTGKAAALSDYTVGGKTGTAQIAEHGHYGGKYVGSFVGIAPARSPQFVILVSVTAPKGVAYGGVVAAPVFKEIAQQAILSRRLPRDKSPETHRARRTRRSGPPLRDA